ncbi:MULTISPECIES: hypothetical protein [Pantoea]|uniref:hypothetical protein n=1 Tax=Pantoea TaxID=53335 RepID=UPI00259581D0|nr:MULTISPECIES: hypothetical protein [Pantoea]
MRLFNPATMTEIIPGLNDTIGAVELLSDNWFFTSSEIPKGAMLRVNERGEPELKEMAQS